MSKTTRRSWQTISLLCAALALGTAAHAQKKTYRCGNVYQDRPCAGEPSASSASSAALAQAAAGERKPRCDRPAAQRGASGPAADKAARTPGC